MLYVGIWKYRYIHMYVFATKKNHKNGGVTKEDPASEMPSHE